MYMRAKVRTELSDDWVVILGKYRYQIDEYGPWAASEIKGGKSRWFKWKDDG
jgi:hypothetical protein